MLCLRPIAMANASALGPGHVTRAAQKLPDLHLVSGVAAAKKNQNRSLVWPIAVKKAGEKPTAGHARAKEQSNTNTVARGNGD